MTNKEQSILKTIYNHANDNIVSSDFLVQLIECGFDLLNAETIPNYAKKTGLSYNGVKNNRELKTIRGVKFVIDNE